VTTPSSRGGSVAGSIARTSRVNSFSVKVRRPPEPPPVAPEDDIPEDDDPDLDESALSGHELIVRELGATVVEEFSNE
ncbi:hypothetical protein ACWEN3_17210, partial [Streptomyces sp. NPDC004561]